MTNKLVLIDSHAILHRAYHALPPLTSKIDGRVINAVYGFMTMLLTILENQKPTHLICAFDLPKPNFRQQIYMAYQGKRPEMESNLVEQIPMLKSLLDALKIQRFEVAGYEADDVIGTLAVGARFSRPNRGSENPTPTEVVIVTGDRDMLQLVNEHVKVCVPVKGLGQTKTFDEKTIIAEFGVTPSQWVDVKALKGDASDNYPGVAGIGPKTAEKLIQEYGTLENLYSKLGQFGKLDKLAKRLAEGAESAGLGKKLATIVTDVPGVRFNSDECLVSSIDWESGIEMMRENFGFRTIVERILKLNKTNKANETNKTRDESKVEQMRLLV